MFYFQKEYYSSTVTSSGIVKDAKVPGITVEPTKGGHGYVTLNYSDSNGATGKFKLRAYCGNKQVDIETYDTSATYHNGGSRRYYIDFYKAFGQSYEGNDVTYEAWVKNNYNKESKSTGRKGGHRFNGRPSIPNGIYVNGQNNLIYNKITFTWNRSSDPDNDSIIYIPYLKTTKKNGQVIRDGEVSKGVSDASFNYDISNDPDGCSYVF